MVKKRADLKAKLVKADAGKVGADEAAPQTCGKKLADGARKRMKALEARGQKAIAANPRNPNAGWLAEVVANSEGRFTALEKYGTEPYIGNVQKHLDWLEDSVKRFEADAAEEASTGGGSARDGGASAKDEAPPDGVVPDAGKLAARERKRLKALETRGRKAIGDDPGNKRGDWLTEVDEDFGRRIDEVESEGTRRQADDVNRLEQRERVQAVADLDSHRRGLQPLEHRVDFHLSEAPPLEVNDGSASPRQCSIARPPGGR
jgi:hypothetical protein